MKGRRKKGASASGKKHGFTESRKAGNSSISRLAMANNSKNRSRSVFIIIAIMLSTLLLTMISSYAFGLIKYDKASAGTNYGLYYGMFSIVDSKELAAVRDNDAFDRIGIIRSAGYVESDNDISLASMDDVAKELSSMEASIEIGKAPEKENEIMGSKSFFGALGYDNPEIGDRIKISYRPDRSSRFSDREFVISGIMRQSEAEKAGIDSGSYSGVISEEFVKSVMGEGDRCSVVFTLDGDIKINSDNAADVIGEYAAECGIDESRIRINTMYILLALAPGTEIILVAVILMACVILFSMVVIYNIFQISLVQRMQEYGRIKAIGATDRQLRRLINKEGMTLAAPAIPAGAALGYLAARLSFSRIAEAASGIQNTADVEFSFFTPPAVIGSMVLALITVWLALRKPKRTISRISAVEAIDYREGSSLTVTGKRRRRKKGKTGHESEARRSEPGLRKGFGSIDERRLALANIASDRKHSLMTMTTMGLTCVMFVVMANCVGNIDEEYEARKSVPHGQFEIALDYTFYDKAYPENNLDTILKDNPLNEDLIRRIEKIDGVTKVLSQDILVSKMNGQLDSVEILNREDFERRLSHGREIGEFDYDTASEQNQIIYGWSFFLEESGHKIGDTIEGSLFNGSSEKDFTLTLGGAFGNSSCGWAITEDTARKLGFTRGSSTGVLWVDSSEEDAEAIEEKLESLIFGIRHVEMETWAHSLEEQTFGMRIIKSGIYSLLIAIGVIGFANLANMMIISITTKRREYGIMQAVGMTDRQLGKSLSFQGLIYIGGTLAVSMLLGIPIGYAVFRWCREKSFFGINVYHFPGIELVLMTVVLVAMQLTLSYLLSRNLKRESLVERIRI